MDGFRGKGRRLGIRRRCAGLTAWMMNGAVHVTLDLYASTNQPIIDESREMRTVVSTISACCAGVTGVAQKESASPISRAVARDGQMSTALQTGSANAVKFVLSR